MHRVVCVLTLLAFSAVPSVWGATCGGSGIPFRFEVLPGGIPVLGCAAPSCFGGLSGGTNILHDSKFKSSREGEDGFFREGDLARARVRFPSANAQTAKCPSGFSSRSCANSLTWVGGFIADADGSLTLQCCQYEGLRFASEVGRPVVHPGEVYSGGEVLRDGRQTGFDLISNVKKIIAEDGSLAYELTVSRMNCLADPMEITNDVGLDAGNDISRILDKVGEVQAAPVQRAYGSGLVSADGYVSPGLADNSITQNQGYGQAPSDFVPSDPGNTIEQEQLVQVGEEVVPVTSAGYYYPVASGIPACFTGDTVVETSKGRKTMNELKIGDEVLTTENNATFFTPIISFLHRLPEVEAAFIHIETPNKHVKLTPQHFIYRYSCFNPSMSELVYAEDMKMDDCLLVQSEEGFALEPISSVQVVKEKGVYAPMTENGDLLANGVHVSCHNVIKSTSLTYDFLRIVSSMQHKVSAFFGKLPDGQLPATSEFFLSIIDYIIPHKH